VRDVDGGPVGGVSPGFRSALAHREFRWFVTHHLLAGTGQSLGTVAVATVLYQQTGSATWVGLAAAARLLPYLVCSGPAGVLVDRFDRRRLLLVSAAARAVVVLVLVTAIGAGAPPWVTVAVVFAGTALGTGSFPAALAVIPSTVRERDVAPATATLNTVETAAWMIGPALGGLLVLAASPLWALTANAVVFLIGAIALLPTRPRPVVRADQVVTTGFTSNLLDGARTILRSPEIRCPLVLVVAVNLVLGAAPIVLLVASQDRFGADGSQYALLMAALGIGGFAGVALTNRLARRGDLVGTLTWSMAAGCVPFALLAVSRDLVSALVLVALAGAAMVVTEVVALTAMLQTLPDHVIGRVFGLVDSTLVASVLIGSVVAGPAIAVAGRPAAMVAIGALVPVVAAAGSRWRRTGPRVEPVTVAA
jgi:MFS family permease